MSIRAELQAAADEELARALDLKWRDLARIVPWGDSHEGIAPSGRTVCYARGYLWAAEAGGDILCEVAVYEDQIRYDDGVRVSAVIRRP